MTQTSRGARIKALRIEKSLTQDALAAQTGLGAPVYNKVETDQIELSVAVAERIADALGVSPAKLVGWEV